MSTVFVIQNQHGHYLGKQQQWLDGSDKRLLYRSPHRDEAVNVVFELSSKDISLRAAPLECQLDASNNPKVEAGPAIALAADEEIEAETSTAAVDEDDTAEPEQEQGPEAEIYRQQS